MKQLSVITINWNNSFGLQKTIESVIRQTYTDFEFIVIDGNSTDCSVDVIMKYESNITIWKSEADNGIYDAMNKAIQLASGEYLLFLNSGDFLISNTVLESVFATERTTDFIFGCVKKEFGYRIVPPSTITFYSALFDIISHQSSFIKKSLFKEFGLYDVNVKIVADWKFLFEAIVVHQKSYEVIKTTIAYCDSKGVSGTSKGINESANTKYAIARKNFPGTFDDIVELHYFKKRTVSRIYYGIIRRCYNFLVNLSN